jgi:hypothetical protein
MGVITRAKPHFWAKNEDFKSRVGRRTLVFASKMRVEVKKTLKNTSKTLRNAQKRVKKAQKQSENASKKCKNNHEFTRFFLTTDYTDFTDFLNFFHH